MTVYARDAAGKKIVEFPKCVLIHESIFTGEKWLTKCDCGFCTQGEINYYGN